MTVQNYIGQFQQASELDLSEIEDMIDELVRQMLMDIFSEGEEGQITIDRDVIYYTKSEIESMLRDYLTKGSASATYATKTTLNNYYNQDKLKILDILPTML